MTNEKHWLDGASNIMNAKTTNLRKLAEISGLDPRYFYVGTRLAGVDLKGQNLSGMEFSEIDFGSVDIDFRTRIPGYTLNLKMTTGPAKIALRPDLAPRHVDHIRRLVSEGFYNGIVFHRVIDGFMAQTGCPHGTGMGGSKYPNLKQEFNAEPHVRGICSMARAQDPNSANSQFFICFGDASFLNKQYTVWGKVVSGMGNIDKLKRGEPVRGPDKIVSATLS